MFGSFMPRFGGGQQRADNQDQGSPGGSVGGFANLGRTMASKFGGGEGGYGGIGSMGMNSMGGQPGLSRGMMQGIGGMANMARGMGRMGRGFGFGFGQDQGQGRAIQPSFGAGQDLGMAPPQGQQEYEPRKALPGMMTTMDMVPKNRQGPFAELLQNQQIGQNPFADRPGGVMGYDMQGNPTGPSLPGMPEYGRDYQTMMAPGMFGGFGGFGKFGGGGLQQY